MASSNENSVETKAQHSSECLCLYCCHQSVRQTLAVGRLGLKQRLPIEGGHRNRLETFIRCTSRCLHCLPDHTVHSFGNRTTASISIQNAHSTCEMVRFHMLPLWMLYTCHYWAIHHCYRFDGQTNSPSFNISSYLERNMSQVAAYHEVTCHLETFGNSPFPFTQRNFENLKDLDLPKYCD